MKKAAVAPWRWWNWLYNNYAREVTAGIALVVLLLAMATFLIDRANARQDHQLTEQTAERAADNTANSVTSCQNGNEQREASRTLWYFVVDLASKDAKPDEIAYLSQIRVWIGEVYQPHDCTNLAKKYPIPPPPTLPPAAS